METSSSDTDELIERVHDLPAEIFSNILEMVFTPECGEVAIDKK